MTDKTIYIKCISWINVAITSKSLNIIYIVLAGSYKIQMFLKHFEIKTPINFEWQENISGYNDEWVDMYIAEWCMGLDDWDHGIQRL